MFPAFFPLLKPARTRSRCWRTGSCGRCVLMVVVIAAAAPASATSARSRPRVWLLLACASALISVNWGIYIYAVNNGHVVDAALGYFINPLVTVALGVLIFRERLNRAQFVALAIAVDRRGGVGRGGRLTARHRRSGWRCRSACTAR